MFASGSMDTNLKIWDIRKKRNDAFTRHTRGDLCIHDGKLLDGAYYENYSVAVWIADIPILAFICGYLESSIYSARFWVYTAF